VSFTLRAAGDGADLEITPLCAYRDYHSHTLGDNAPEVALEERGCRLSAYPGARAYRLLIEGGSFSARPEWYWNFHHRLEQARGLDARENLFRPGVFGARLNPAQSMAVVATAETRAPEPQALAYKREQKRRAALLEAAPAAAPPWIRRLTLAADQFIVRRAGPDGELSGTTVIAGYPWFSDWGRDTMIALPGLTLATGRRADAGSILRTFAAHMSEGMLPNRFPDAGTAPEYNTVDATLWYFHAVAAYLQESGDQELLRDLYPTLTEIIDWHRRGTRYGIHMDPADGLLYAGESGVQLTWMDAKVGDWVITPRTGKAVEVNALWYYALSCMGFLARKLGDRRAAANYDQTAKRVATEFSEAFWFEEGGYLYDVIDTPDGTPDARGRRVDRSLRPNQLFAVSLGSGLLDADRARAVIETCARELLTPVGLRSLAPSDPKYTGHYGGGPTERDAAYHQGTVWSWLLGPFAIAHYRVYGDAAHASALLAGLAAHVDEACMGTISEILDGNPPHVPRGCFAQAWSVSETLRAYHHLARSRTNSRDRLTRFSGG
jgi:predicted glycogen debranching enzyme